MPFTSYKYQVALLLHILGHRILDIAPMLGLSSLRIQRFIQGYARKQRPLYRVSALKERIEEAMGAYLETKKSPYSPRVLLQYAQTIELLTDAHKVNLYTLDAYEQLVNAFTQRIKHAKHDKRAWFDAMQYTLLLMSERIEQPAAHAKD